MLGEKDRELVERVLPEWHGRVSRIGPDTGLAITGRELAAIIAATRAEAVAPVVEALRPFAELYRDITESCGPNWLPDDAGAMRASLSFPTAKMPVRWRSFRRAAEALAGLEQNSGG